MIREFWETVKSIARPAGLLGIIAIVIGFMTELISPGLEFEFFEFGSASASRPLLIAGVVLLAVFAVGSLEDLRNLFFAPGTRYSTNSIVMIVVFLTIIVFLNALWFRNSPSIDITAAGRFTISEQTKQILRELDVAIKITGFYSPDRGASQQLAEDLVKQYEAHTDLISHEFVDPLAQPASAAEYQIQRDATLIFEAGETRQAVDLADEQSFTSAILKVTQTVQKKVYFIEGHGEGEYNDFRDTGYGAFTNALRADNYEVVALSLVAEETVPEDASVVIIVAPQLAYQETEIAALQAYLDGGGKLLVLYDGRAETGLQEMLALYGVVYRTDIDPGLIIDEQSLTVDPFTPVVDRYGTFNEITRNLQVTFYIRPGIIEIPENRNTEIAPQTNLDYTLRATSIAATTDRSWIESTPDAPPYAPDTSELEGPFTLVAQVEKFVPLGVLRDPNEPVGLRMVVFTDSDFISNQFIDAFFNRDIAVNSVNWLAGDEKLISIRPRPADIRQLFISSSQIPFIFISSVILLPAVVLLAGTVVWWRRR